MSLKSKAFIFTLLMVLIFTVKACSDKSNANISETINKKTIEKVNFMKSCENDKKHYLCIMLWKELR